MAHYSALGRIRSIILLDNASVITSVIKDVYETFYESVQKHQQMPINVWIFCAASFQDITHSSKKLTYFGQMRDRNLDVDTYWAQDIFVIPSIGSLRYFPEAISNSDYRFLFDQLKTIGLNPQKWDVDIDGGNLLHGKSKAGDYLLIGPDFINYENTRQSRVVDFQLLANSYKKGTRLVRLLNTDFDLKTYFNLFYHADTFCTIAGPDKNEMELIIFSQVEDHSGIIGIDKLNTELKTQANRVKKEVEQGQGDVRIEYLPMMIFLWDEKPIDDSPFHFVLNFNNMIIENYKVNETTRKRIAYIPDYLPTWISSINLAKQKEREDVLVELFVKVIEKYQYYSENNLLSEDQIFDFDKEKLVSRIIESRGNKNIYSEEIFEQLTVAVIVTATDRVINDLINYGFDSVEKITFGQYVIPAKNYPAAAHCRVKVVERDCLP